MLFRLFARLLHLNWNRANILRTECILGNLTQLCSTWDDDAVYNESFIFPLDQRFHPFQGHVPLSKKPVPRVL